MAEIRRRTALKASLTRLKTAVDAYDDTTITAAVVKAQSSKLKKLEADIEAIHETLIANSADQAEADAHQVDHELTEQRLMDLTTILLEFEEKLRVRNPQAAVKAEFHLPKMELPVFTGDIRKWQSFHDLFNSMVHSNSSLSAAQKLQYLKVALKGEAARLIENFQVTDANYQGAWDALQDRYANERVIVFAQIQRLLEQQPIQQESAQQLRRFIDTSNEALRSLENLHRDTAHWDDLLIFILSQKLDPETRRRWEMQLPDTKVPKFTDFIKFLTQHAVALDSICTTRNRHKQLDARIQANNKPHEKNVAKAHQVTAASQNCPLCDQRHTVYKCESFTQKAVGDRIKAAKEANLCFNCLKKGHSANNCSSSNCRTCNGKHNTLLHREQPTAVETSETQIQSHVAKSPANVLLGTAVVHVKDSHGNIQECRVLLDTGSQASFISNSCLSHLGLKKIKTNVDISGIAAAGAGTASTKTEVSMCSRFNANNVSFEAYVLTKVTSDLPNNPCNIDSWPHLKNLCLADPDFNKPRKVDMLLGADVLPDLLLESLIKGGKHSPTAQNTTLGWVVFGPTCTKPPTAVQVNHVECNLDTAIERFWNLEELGSKRALTAEEVKCEEHFNETCYRNADGSYTVELPFKSDPAENLGESRTAALRRFQQIERKLTLNSKLQQQYTEFMKEFIESGHMEEVNRTELDKPVGQVYYLPHHSVQKEASTTTKLRVVFNASTRTSSGTSLNQLLMVGPVLQDELFEILTRYRSFQVPMVADLKQMFRHFWLHEKHRDYLRIIWRGSKDKPITEYRLKTVTYGTACATYQATKILQRVADDSAVAYPIASAKIKEDFYIDDFMSGADSVEEALLIEKQVLAVMSQANFTLRKWSSSYTELLQNLPPDMRETQMPLSIDSDDSIKTLGLKWHPSRDYFAFEVKVKREGNTKRAVLSEIASLFDPLGLLTPVTVAAKIFMQSIWGIQLGWDEILPDSFMQQWTTYRQQLPSLEGLEIRRYVMQHNYITAELHGFSDASEQAYAAAVYVRTTSVEGVKCNLIASKSKVAPHEKISLPRLELCGAVLLAKLMVKVERALKRKFDAKICWTDSTIVRDWIHTAPQRWQTFIANRVTKIQNHFDPNQWHHISGKINPADVASRGITAEILVRDKLWWNGPSFLLLEDYSAELSVPPTAVIIEAVHEARKIPVHHVKVNAAFKKRYSSLKKLEKHTAVWKRFMEYLKLKRDNNLNMLKVTIDTEELQQALLLWVNTAQRLEYSAEIKALEVQEHVSVKSKILALNPFLDAKGLLRVGGRLCNAQLPFDRKHPLLLPAKGHLTTLIVRHIHQQQFHAGLQLTLYTVQQRFWIPRGKEFVRGEIRKCTRCFRFSQNQQNQLMGDLPAARLVPSIPFNKTGVDYGGPFTLRPMKIRSNKTYKAYVALFICLATRAIHLELVSDLTTEGFLAALKRFIARRGKPGHIFSDNGSNFVGADRELKEMLQVVISAEVNEAAKRMLQEDGISWKFNPAAAPHMGGIWEAGIKSTKFHLKRVVGTGSLTYEELQTILVQIEGCLNSRPPCPNTADPNQPAALTPGHF